MNSLPILVRREFWEHRSAFVVVPAVMTLFILVMMVLVFTVSITDTIDMTIDLEDQERTVIEGQFSSDNQVAFMLSRLDGMTEMRREEIVNRGLRSLSVPLVVVLWGVIFFYLLACLYDERRDRSILFWKSLPVSDAMTVISKLVTGLLVVPLVYFLGIALLQLSALILLTLAAMGTEISVTETLWGPANIAGNWFGYFSAILFYSLWSLPFFAWLLTVSAFAKSVPLAWALGVPFGLTICERVFTDQTVIADWMGNRVIPLGFLNPDHFSFWGIPSRLFSLQMLSAIVVGAGLVFTAIWFRGKADEI